MAFLAEAEARPPHYLSSSRRFADPRAQLLAGQAWGAARPQVCRTLGHHPDPHTELDALMARLDRAYRPVAPEAVLCSNLWAEGFE